MAPQRPQNEVITTGFDGQIADRNLGTGADFDSLADYRSGAPGQQFQMSPSEREAADREVERLFGRATITDGQISFQRDTDGDGDLDQTPNIDLSFDRDGNGEPEVVIDLNNDGKADSVNVNDLATALRLPPEEAARYLALGVQGLENGPDLNGNGKPDAVEALNTLAQNGNPQDVATLIAYGAMAAGDTVSPEQQQAALASAEAVIGNAAAALGCGSADLASQYGALMSSFSSLNGFKAGYFMQGNVEGMLARVFQATAALIKNRESGNEVANSSDFAPTWV